MTRIKIVGISTVGMMLIIGGVITTWKLSFQVEGTLVVSETQSAAAILGDDYIKYTHPEIGFSLEYPRELKVRRFDEGDDAETVAFQRPGDEDRPANERLGFQIFITLFDDEGTVITPERILRDLPDFKVEEAQEVIIGDGTHALIFWTDDFRLGRIREVWFIWGERLYEITTYAHLDSWLARILSTWSHNAP